MQAQSVILDFLKPVGTIVDLSDKFNARVGDSMTPFNLFVTEGGKPKMLNGLHPELEAAVGDGELKDGKVVMSDNAKGVHWVGSTNNVTGYNQLTLAFPAEVFPQSGFCYGHLILANDTDVRESSVDIWFKVLDGTPLMGLVADHYDSELALELAKAKNENEQFSQEMRAAYNQQVTDTQNALTKATANLNDLAADAGSIQALMKAQDVLYRSDLKKIQDDAEQRIASINTNLKAFKTLDDLKKTYPNGADGIFIAWDTGHKYSWIDNAWSDGGLFQSGSSINEVEDARKWNSKLGRVTSDSLGNAVRDQLNQVEAQFANILDTSVPDMPDSTGKIIPQQKLKLDPSLTSRTVPAPARSVRDAVSLNPSNYEMIYSWKNDANVNILRINGPLPATSDVKTTVSYSYQGMNGSATMKWQGQSSISFPKKNFTIKFDKSFTAKGGWLATDTYVLKGNFNDYTHARNIVSARLWGDVVKSRGWSTEDILDNDGTPLLDNDGTPLQIYQDTMPGLINGGATDGFPIMLVVNGDFYGLYDFQIKKSRTMFGFEKDNHSQYAISCERTPQNKNGAAIHFKGAAILDGNDYDYEYVANDGDKANAKASFNYMIQKVIEATGSDYAKTLEGYLDVDSVIDYMLFTALITAADDVTKNFLMLSYNGSKWYFSAYDMDCTFGNWQDGWIREDPDHAVPSIQHWRDSNRAMHLVCAYDADRVKARYQELRKGPLSDVNVYKRFISYMSLTPVAVKNADVKLWPTTPATVAHSFSQIFNEFKLRVSVIDQQIANL